MASRKKKKKPGVAVKAAPVLAPRPSYPPDSVGVKIFLTLTTAGFAALTVLGIRKVLIGLLTGVIGDGDDAYAWDDEPGGYITEVLFTAFLTVCAGVAVTGGWDALRNGLTQASAKYRKDAGQP